MAPPACRALHGHMNSLLDEKVLVGEGHLCHIELRPQAYGVLAEVVHCLRQELSLEDLSRIISIFIRCPPPPHTHLSPSNLPAASLSSLSLTTTFCRVPLWPCNGRI